MLPGTSFSDPSAQNASQGNPNLTPFKSNNFDASIEWYTGEEGYVSAVGFHKEVTGFTIQGTNTLPFRALGIPFDALTPTQQVAINNRGGPDAATVTVTQQVNAGGVLTIRGYELNWVQPLTFLVDGLGFTANYTRVYQSASGAGAPPVAIGVSPYTYNLTGYYEKGPMSVRLSWTYNDDQISSGPNQNSVPVAQLRTDARGQLDMSASYELDFIPFSPRLTFDAINLTDEPQRQTFEYTNAAFTYYKPGRAFLVGLRAKF
jgi:TonB-dependent receptor